MLRLRPGPGKRRAKHEEPAEEQQMGAGPPDERDRPDDEIAAVYVAAEELAERLDGMRLYKAAAYVSMALDVIREVRNRTSGRD